MLMGCKKHKFSDGGKVLKSEYGEPTFGKSLLAAIGIGDGYGKGTAKKASIKEKRLTIADSASEFPDLLAKRKKMLDDT
jgi:hypothetical protein